MNKQLRQESCLHSLSERHASPPRKTKRGVHQFAMGTHVSPTQSNPSASHHDGIPVYYLL